VSFDPYGCVQVLIHPGLKEDGSPAAQHWLDYSRLEVISEEPVMEAPFGSKGPAPKPTPPVLENSI